MDGKNIGTIILIGIVCFCVGYFAIYLFQQQATTGPTNEINDLNETITSLNADLENNKEFNRYFFKARKGEINGAINEGCGRAYGEEGDYSFSIGSFGLAEIYYGHCMDYYKYAEDEYLTAKLYLEQAQNYITDTKTSDYIDTCIELHQKSIELFTTNYNFFYDMQSASYYYNISSWDQGDIKLEEANSNINQINSLVSDINALLTEIDISLEASWKD